MTNKELFTRARTNNNAAASEYYKELLMRRASIGSKEAAEYVSKLKELKGGREVAL